MTPKSSSTLRYEAIFKAHFSSVKHFIFALLKSEEDAEDLAQDVFTKLWMKPEIWNEDKEIKSYIFTIAKNLTINFINRKKLEANYQDEQMHENLIKELATSDDPSTHLYYKEMLVAIKLTLARLPQACRNIFELSRFQNMTHQEIAAKLHISIRTVEYQIYCALKELKKITFILFFLYFL